MKKYTDVDIIAELQKLVDSHVDSYKEDFDIATSASSAAPPKARIPKTGR